MASLASEDVVSGDRPSAPTYPDWQAALADAIRDPAELCRLLQLDPSLATAAETTHDGFPLLVPRPYVSRIRPGDMSDPLLVQVLPTAAELAQAPGYSTDPLGEAADCTSPQGKGPSLLQKYSGRSLIVTTGTCGVHCRFCFRRHFPFQQGPVEGPAESDPWCETLGRIASDTTIREVILSGGDPLTLSDDRLAGLARRLANIPHLRRLRLHTRLPVLIPQRVTKQLIAWLRGTRLSPVVVIHVNHAAEIDDSVAAALGYLVDSGVPLLSQTVLLRGVNDQTDALAELYERLVDLRVIPYYLHQLDPVSGAAHFAVRVPAGVRLVEQLRARLPGYAVPRYVREVRDGASKQGLA